ncbi:MAG: Cna B-type domain-containing protein, partial [Eubacterium sp.]|nr:Cna B-type domain-containing protein [Eubacterium sp.]
MEKRKWRRILALVLAVLMVVSLVLPGKLSSRERAYAAGEDDITSFLKNVDLYEAGSSTPKDIAWLIDSEKTYGMHVNFAESDAGDKQFHMDPDNRTFTYAFPAGVKVTQVHSPLTILINDSQSIEGTTYAPTLVGDHYVITGTFADDASLRDSRNVKFYLDFDVQFEEGLDELDFGNNVKIPVQYDSESKVTVEKTGFYSTNDGKAHFTVTVHSKRTNHNVRVVDTLTGTAFTGLTIDSITSGRTDISGSVTTNTSANGFDLVIPTMTDGQSVVIDYSVDIDYSKISENGTGTETGNTVDVTSDEDPTPDPVPYNLQNKITYTNLRKGASISGLNADNSKTITYTANYNDACIVPMNGVTLTDVISGAGVTYPADLKLNISKYDKSGTLVAESEVSPATLNDTKWTYKLTDTTPYRYEIKYEVKVPADAMTSNTNISNTITDDRGHKGTAGIDVGPDALGIAKSVIDVDAVNKEVTWNLIISVPKGGLGVNTTVTDSVPATWVDGTEAVENLIQGSFTLLSNNTGATIDYSVTEDTDHKKFVITFPNGITNGTGQDQEVEFSYKTAISDAWVAKSATETWMQDHTNNAEIKSGTQTGRTSATAKVVPPTIKKSSSGKATDGSGYPVYKFEIVVANPTIPLVLEDTFDPELELVTQDTAYANAPRICSGNQYYQGTNETAILPGNISTGAGSFRMSLDESYIYGSDSHYKISYALRVKSTGAYRRLAQRVADTGKDKLVLTNTAKVGEIKDDLTFDFEYSPVTKSLTNENQFPETGEGVSLYSAVAQYQVVINPLALTLNNGEPMTATDTFTNLAIDYTSIKFVPSDAGITCSASGNILTIRNIPDATQVTMTYSSRPSGTPGADGKLTISNEFETSGHLAVSRKSFKVKADAGGTGSIRHIKIFKHDDDDLLKGLKGASFKMYDANKVPMKWKAGSAMGAPTEDVVITTNENGIAVLSQYDVDFKSSDDTYKNVYYLKEIKAPDGYLVRDTWYQFMVIEGTDPDYTKFEYVDGDIMKIRNNKPNFYFTKVNEKDEPLAGAEFTLYDEGKTSLGITAVSDAEGIVSFKDLPVAATGDTTLYIKETAVPDPQYALDENYYKIVFTHDADGNLKEKERDIPARFPNTKEEPKTSVTLEKILDTTSVAGTAVEATVKAQSFPIEFTLTAPAGKAIPASVTAVVTKVDSTKENREIPLTNGAGTVSLAGGESAKISGLPRGTEYVVKETADRDLETKGFVYDNTATSNGYTGTLANDGTTKVTVTNGYGMPKTSLKVSKIWDDENNKGAVRPNDISVQLKSAVTAATAATPVGAAVTLNAANNWSYTWNSLDKFDADLNEINYSVAETDATVRALSVCYDAGNPVKVVDPFAAAAYTITNTLKTGDLTVTKSVVSSTPADKQKSFTFTVTLNNTSVNGTFGDMTFTDGVATFTLKDGESKTATGLPVSVGYTVTEASTDGFTTTKTGDTGSISTTASTAAFTNTKEEGSLVVKKTLVSDLAADADQSFAFTVTLSNTAVNGTYGDMTFTNGVATFTLKGGETKSAVGLPKGTTYTVTETADASFTTTKTGDTGSISDAAVTAEFTNTRKTGDLTVTKTVVSSTAADKTKDFTFTVTLDDTTISGTYGGMTFTDGVATFTLKDSQSKTATGLPTSVGYTVAETAADGFTTTKTGDTGSISTTASTATFTNTKEEGSLIVKKTLVSNLAADADKDFSFTVTLGDLTLSGTYGDMTFTNGVETFTFKGGETKSAVGLPK